MRWVIALSLLITLMGCRTDKPPALSLICFPDGFGGMDCSAPDGTHAYLKPTQTRGMWCAPNADVALFTAWCYKTSPQAAAAAMKGIRTDALK